MVKRTGGQHLIAALEANGVQRIFGVPGESYLGALDALVDSDIEFIQCRHEAGAANMAEAHGKLTEQPGVCFVTRGPGATQAAVGVHTAFQDSTPMILLVGQVRREDEGREAFQELDYAQAFNGIAKAAFEIRDAARIPEQILRAFSLAVNGRPGPVVVSLPEDMLTEVKEAIEPLRFEVAFNGIDPIFQQLILNRINDAQRPIVMVGGANWDESGAFAVERFSEKFMCPVVTSFRAKHLMNNDHRLYAGEAGIGANPKLVQALRDSDLIVAIGPRLGEMTTQSYNLFGVPGVLTGKLIHIHSGAEELNRVYHTEESGVAAACAAMVSLLEGSPKKPTATRIQWCKDRRADYEAFSKPVKTQGDLNPSEIWAEVSSVIGHSAIITNGAGNFAAWLHRFYQHQTYPSQLAPTSGAMGYGLPAAIAAKLEYPEKPVIAVCGDGDFMMAVPELATAVQHGTNIIVCVFDNSAYGTIRMHQERNYPGRVSGTDLINPDFKAMAESFGVIGHYVETTDAFLHAMTQALGANRPSLIHARMSVKDIAPEKTIPVT